MQIVYGYCGQHFWPCFFNLLTARNASHILRNHLTLHLARSSQQAIPQYIHRIHSAASQIILDTFKDGVAEG